MLCDDQIFSFLENIRETLQNFHNLLLDILAKMWQFGVYTLFLTCSTVEFHLTEIIQIVVLQYSRNTNRETSQCGGCEYKGKLFKKKSSYCSKANWLCIKQLWEEVMLSGMYATGQILNFHNPRKFQNKGAELMHACSYSRCFKNWWKRGQWDSWINC